MRHRSGAAVYAVCIPLSAVLGIYEGNCPGAVPVYVTSVLAVAALNRYVSLGLRRPDAQSPLKHRFLDVMLALGFVELRDIKRIQKPKALSADVSDDYIQREPPAPSADSSRASSVDSDIPADWHPTTKPCREPLRTTA